MTGLPSGTATFLFTDIEGSTKLVHELGDAFDALLETHRSLLRKTFQTHGGHEIGTEGDSFFVAFARATDALRAAVDGQRALTAYDWPGGRAIRVRMGMHTGEARLVANDYVGLAVHQAARVSSAANGGQILISEATRALVQGDLPTDVRLRDMGQHHLKDLPRAETLFQVDHPELPTDFAPIRSLDVRRHNLPTQLTTFIGRESELADVRKLIGSNRLVTLTGAGGSGKTRLALETAADVLTEFTDGARLVDLAPVTDPDAILQAVANALGLREQEGRTIESVLEDYFSLKEMLLILDNCEHLVAAAADLVERLLKFTADLRILVTTREPLGVDGEIAWRVPSLGVPDPRDTPTADDLHRSPAVRLFTDRASSVDPDFAPTDDDMGAIAQICYRLDGIPLAIELAAARMDVLSPEQIVERLHDRFRLLTGGRRTALARQQTLQALVDWSYDLLDERERALLERISVFVGSFTLEAAEQVCAEEPVERTDVLDVLSGLVRKSLLTADKAGGRARYRMLETVKQYGRDKLIRSPQATMLRARHLDHYLELAERHAPDFAGANQRLAIDAIEPNHDDMRAALEWSLSERDVTKALRLSYALWRFWWIRGHWTEGRRWYAQMLALDEAPGDWRARVLSAAAFFAKLQGDADAAVSLAEECFPLADAFGDSTTRGYALWSISSLGSSFDTERTKKNLTEAMAIARETHNDQLAHWARVSMLAVLDDEGAHAVLAEAEEIARRAGDRWNLAMTLNHRGALFVNSGDIDRGEAMIDESVRIWRDLDDTYGLAQALAQLGQLASYRGDHPQGIERLREAIDIADQIGHRRVLHTSLNSLAWTLHIQGRSVEALPYAERCVGDPSTRPSDSFRTPALRATSLHTLGVIHRALGSNDRAGRAFAHGLDAANREGISEMQALLLEELAPLGATPADAAQMFGAAEAIREEAGAIERQDQPNYAGDLAELRGAMDTDGFVAAWEEGRADPQAVVIRSAQNPDG